MSQKRIDIFPDEVSIIQKAAIKYNVAKMAKQSLSDISQV